MVYRPLVVGEAPPEGASFSSHSPMYPYPPNCSGHRLMKMTGLSVSEYLRIFDRANLVSDIKAADKWDRTVALFCAASLLRGGILRNRDVLLLGKKVHEAFSLLPEWTTRRPISKSGKPAKLFKWYGLNSRRELYGTRFVLLPHPSGRSTVWRDVENVRKCESVLNETIENWRADEGEN